MCVALPAENQATNVWEIIEETVGQNHYTVKIRRRPSSQPASATTVNAAPCVVAAAAAAHYEHPLNGIIPR